jgi:hypothetical protein
MSFLQRYLDDEREAVWSELAALGAGVREPGVIEDARAVARETMRRARSNLELIVERLDTLGYSFWDGVRGPRPPPGKRLAMRSPTALTFGTQRLEAATTPELLAMMFAEAGELPASALTPVMAEQLHDIYRTAVWPWQDTARLMRGERHPADATAVALFEEAKRSAPADLPALLPALRQASAAAVAALQAAWEAREATAPPPPSTGRSARRVLQPPRKQDAALIGRLAERGLAMPLALAAWIEEVGSVNLAGSHPELCFWDDASFPGVYADPLMIDIDMAEIDAWQAEAAPGPLEVVVGWDARSKARLTVEDVELDFGYAVTLPDTGADPPLKGVATPNTFVGHLRRAFAFGGFPGWAGQTARPDAELRRLTEGLERI